MPLLFSHVLGLDQQTRLNLGIRRRGVAKGLFDKLFIASVLAIWTVSVDEVHDCHKRHEVNKRHHHGVSEIEFGIVLDSLVTL